MNHRSAVDFAPPSRVHIALAVRDLERSRSFYETLLQAPPAKQRPGYAKFEPQAPPVNLTLNQVAADASDGPLVSHFGIQVKSSDEVRAAHARLVEAGFATRVEEHTTCCYAVQDKVWVTDPDGHAWEVFVVTEADADARKSSASEGCATSTAPAAEACC